MTDLRITEIFHSLQGESSLTGFPTVFVRLTGCPLRCFYCDTEYAFTGGETCSIEDIIGRVSVFHAQYVCVTGGEPLAQKACHQLLAELCDHGYSVSLETSGALPIEEVDKRVKMVMDIKTPDSGEAGRNLWSNLAHLSSKDEIKCVVCSLEDYEWFKDLALSRDLYDICPVLLSPSANEVEPRELAEWILQDQLNVRFQIQLHKYLWDDSKGR